MVEFDFGKVENIIGFDKYIEEKLSEKQKIIDEQQATIEQLKSELNDCEKFRYQVFKRIGELSDE